MDGILITGASSGIGYATAIEFARNGYRVFGSILPGDDAQYLQNKIGPNFIPMTFDITDANALKEAAQKVEYIVGNDGLTGLINNAGIITSGPLIYQPVDEIRKQFEVNVFGQISVIQAFFPLLKSATFTAARAVRIINMSSIGGKISGPFIGAYSGSKHALEGMSHSLRKELLLHGIDVIIIGPGPVNTPLFDQKAAQDTSQYDRTEYRKPIEIFQQYIVNAGKSGYSPDVVGQFVRSVFETRHPKARYSLVQKPIINWFLRLVLPVRWADRLMGKKLGLLHK